MSTTVKSQTKNDATTKTSSDSVSQGSLITMGVASALGGLWAIVCLTSAMLGTGSPLELIKRWFSAVSGM